MAAGALSSIGRWAVCVAAAASLAACASVGPEALNGPAAPQKIGGPYQVGGIWYVPREQPDYDAMGTASWYGDAFHGKSTADGEIFDMNAVTGAHTTLPLPCVVEVTNLDNGRRLRVRVNDRGPFVGGRIIDLSHEAARQLGYDRQGLARVRVRYIGPAPLLGPEAGVRVARAKPPAPAAPQTQEARASLSWPEAPAAQAAQPASATVRWREVSGAASASAAPLVLTATSAPIAVETLPAPVRPAAAPIPAADPDAPAPARSIEAWRQAPAAGFRIQAGAFSEEARARRVADQLAALGAAIVEPVQRGGATLYRVMLPAPADELQAYNLRERVAEQGFADARVVRSF